MVIWQSEDPTWSASVYRPRWEALLRAALQQHDLDPDAVDLTLHLVGRETMRRYHLRYRGTGRDTDVLAFPDGTPDPETGRLYLGDVLVCVPVAQEQAQRLGHPWEEEMCLLTLHGVLHLLGYDDETPEARQTMWEAQARLLRREGCEHVLGP